MVASSQARLLRRPAPDPGGSHCRSGPAKAGARPGMPAQGCHGGTVENCRTPVVPAMSPVPGRNRQRRRTQGSVAPEERPKIPIAVARHVSSLGLPGRRPCLATAASLSGSRRRIFHAEGLPRVAIRHTRRVRGTPSPSLPARGRVSGGVDWRCCNSLFAIRFVPIANCRLPPTRNGTFPPSQALRFPDHGPHSVCGVLGRGCRAGAAFGRRCQMRSFR